MAQLLGYKNFAEYATSISMAKTPEKELYGIPHMNESISCHCEEVVY